MKHAIQSKKRSEKEQARSLPATGPGTPPPWKRRALLGFCMLLAAGGAWAVMELVVWNKLPTELVGKWVVQGGEQEGATFDFYRSGAMVGRINMRGQEGIIHATVAVEGDTLLITTQNPRTKLDETKKQTIKTLNATSLVLQDEHKNLFRMERADNLP